MMAVSALAASRTVAGGRDADAATVLVIGATGFVGAAVARAALARHDMQPIGCARRPDPRPDPLVKTRVCDAADPVALAQALEGATYVVNCVLSNPAVMLATTRNLCHVAGRLGVRRIVHLSSMAVYGPATGLVNETTALRPDGTYGRAKADCEAIVREYVAAGGDAVVIRPGCVYGPGGEQWVGRIGRWLRAGRLGELDQRGDGYCNLTFNDDLANAVVASLTAPNVAGETFNIADAGPGTWNQFFARLGEAIGAPDRRISELRLQLETMVLAPPLQVAKLVARRLGLPPAFLPEPIPPSLSRLWRQQMRLDSTKAESLLPFPRTSPQQGLARAADWFLSQYN
jgi:nucleoside-diphosphate-sugar epimerase